MTAPHDLTMTEAVSRMNDGSLTAAALMESVLDRMTAIPQVHHPYVMVRPREELIAEAEQADQARASGQTLGPMHGIPLAIKDIVDVAGIPTKCNSPSMANAAPAATDARLVQKWKAAGGIVVGKTVTQEFAAGTISAPSRNPWDLDRIPGGSSGGSAAAVAAGMALMSIGTDTGGSIRCPASVCGVTGLKPTYGTVSRIGIFPLAWSLDTAGPIGRTVQDCVTAMAHLVGHDPRDPGSSPTMASVGGELGHKLDGLRIGLPRAFFYDRIEDGVAELMNAAAQTLARLGADIIEADWDLATEARAVSMVINRVETSAVHEQRVRRQADQVGDEWRLRVKAGLLMPATSYVRAHQARIVIRRSMADYFNRHQLDAMVTLATPGAAAAADSPVLTYTDGSQEHVLSAYTRFTMPLNATGQPAISIPIGFTPAGLPIGMQVAGRPFAEARICRIAHAYEQECRWIDRRPNPTGGS